MENFTSGYSILARFMNVLYQNYIIILIHNQRAQVLTITNYLRWRNLNANNNAVSRNNCDRTDNNDTEWFGQPKPEHLNEYLRRQNT